VRSQLCEEFVSIWTGCRVTTTSIRTVVWPLELARQLETANLIRHSAWSDCPPRKPRPKLPPERGRQTVDPGQRAIGGVGDQKCTKSPRLR
jgi:hypothetical protein